MRAVLTAMGRLLASFWNLTADLCFEYPKAFFLAVFGIALMFFTIPPVGGIVLTLVFAVMVFVAFKEARCQQQADSERVQASIAPSPQRCEDGSWIWPDGATLDQDAHERRLAAEAALTPVELRDPRWAEARECAVRQLSTDAHDYLLAKYWIDDAAPHVARVVKRIEFTDQCRQPQEGNAAREAGAALAARLIEHEQLIESMHPAGRRLGEMVYRKVRVDTRHDRSTTLATVKAVALERLSPVELNGALAGFTLTIDRSFRTICDCPNGHAGLHELGSAVAGHVLRRCGHCDSTWLENV
jgi:hypothetical protein